MILFLEMKKKNDCGMCCRMDKELVRYIIILQPVKLISKLEEGTII